MRRDDTKLANLDEGKLIIVIRMLIAGSVQSHAPQVFRAYNRKCLIHMRNFIERLS